MTTMIKEMVVNDEKDWFVEDVGVHVRTHVNGNFRSLSVTLELSFIMNEHPNTMRLLAVDDALHIMIPGALVTYTPIMAKFVAATEEIEDIQRTINLERWEEQQRKPLTWWQKFWGYSYPKKEVKDPKDLILWFLNRVRPCGTKEREKYIAPCYLGEDSYGVLFEDPRKKHQTVELVFQRAMRKRSVRVEIFGKDPKQAFQQLSPFIEALEKGGVHNFGITNFKLLREVFASNTALSPISSTPAE